MIPAGVSGPRRPCRRGPHNRLWIGLFLIGLGALFALSTYGVVDVEPLWGLWPLVLVFFGVRGTVRSRGRNAGSLVLLFLGVWFLLENFDLLPIDHRLVPASILVIIGFSFALSALVSRRLPTGGRFAGAPPADPTGVSPDPRAAASARVHSTAVLGSVSQATASQDFRGGSAAAFLGSCEIDLRQAAILRQEAGGPAEAELEAYAVWGGVRIFVPEGWTVALDGTSILGAFHDFTRQPAASGQRLVVTGLALMGGVEIRNEREDWR